MHDDSTIFIVHRYGHRALAIKVQVHYFVIGRNWSYLVELENKRARRNDFHTIRRRNFMEDDNFHVSTRRRIEQRETRNTGYTRGRRRRRRKRKEKKKISRRL